MAPETKPKYLILNAQDFPVADLLAPEPPAAAVLATRTDLKWAGRYATEVIRGVRKHLAQNGKPLRAVIVRGTDPHDVRYYHVDWKDATSRTARHRYLCGNYPQCENPLAPWMFYCPPSKNPEREGPQVCETCFKRHGSDRQKEAVSRMNRDRGGKK